MTETKKSGMALHWLTAVASRLGYWLFALVGTAGVIFLLMLLAGVFSPKVESGSTKTVRPLPPDAVFVAVESVRQPRFESAVGSIEPVHQSTVATKILAKVIEANATAGQAVKAGDVLVRLNDEEFQLQLKQAEAQLESARANVDRAKLDFDRAENLVTKAAISRADFDAAANALRTSEAEMERANRAIDELKVVLGYATVTAPFDGIVVDKKVDVGDTVQPGQPLLTIYDPTKMQLVADVRESLALQLKVGQTLTARLEALNQVCQATVSEIVPQSDRGSRSFQVKVSGPCPAGIYSGMFGRIDLPLDDEELVLIPSEVVRNVGQLNLVDVVEGDHMIRRAVQLGRLFGDRVEVLAGLEPGEKVLRPGPQETREPSPPGI